MTDNFSWFNFKRREIILIKFISQGEISDLGFLQEKCFSLFFFLLSSGNIRMELPAPQHICQ